MITKIFNTQLHTESFTYKTLKIKPLQAKNLTVKAEKRKLAECARYAREADERVMAAARTTADSNSATAESNDATTDKKLRNGGGENSAAGERKRTPFRRKRATFREKQTTFLPTASPIPPAAC